MDSRPLLIALAILHFVSLIPSSFDKKTALLFDISFQVTLKHFIIQIVTG